ncbi:DUF2382 domain-containing protein [Planobispora longispora]|uniref:Photosystem reaction center subunit H n=1 Tax=Planobispora longispora TaxID=28887 RepID=A0A8J3RDU9_9ACTN|nr:PRC and DUF2382 domain-containing protein [Planobispora longispora]BFE77638.1 PRC and DUF2382 domain-containing protein [Planobispora longispora]GIH73882.1 photosystem reaction center subunit H [Planobispora longispora]
MITQNQIQTVINQDVYDITGEKIGEVKHVYLDEATGRPEWLCVKTGLFGTKETFVPAQAADVVADHVEVGYPKDRVKDAPSVDVEAGGHLSPDEERELYRYYDIDWDSSWHHANRPGEAGGRAGWAHTGGQSERERLGRTDEAMTRSEERLQVGTETHQAGKARLRKYVVTEEQQVSVPVSHEEVRIEREPITGANRDAALSGPDISEAEHEVTLHAEHPVVDKRTVPVERIRMGKETVTGREAVSGQVRKEHVEVEGDTDDSGRRF